MDASARSARAAERPDFVSPQLAAALSHPIRVKAMCILHQRVASPREIAKEIEEPLNNVTYHVNQLRELGCIELARTEGARGGRVVEHFYRSCQRPFFDEDAWNVLTEKERLGVVGAILKMMAKDIATAMAAGTFFGGGDVHTSRSALRLDEDGWQEVTRLIRDATAGLIEIEERVAERAAEGKQATINAKLDILQYRLPPSG